ncbi:MAG: heme lyase CcmF/NrfE family subunit [Pseudomonadota bacterium]
MIVEFGHFALILATALALYQTVVPAWGAQLGDRGMMQSGVSSAVGQFALISIAFGALTYAYVTSDFSVTNVATNSHSAKPLIYKISGVWGNHEGSMLLWILILVLFGAAVAIFGSNLPDTLKANVLSVQASITLAFCLFVLFTSNPFERLAQAPVEGLGLNPILQDPALAFHPPFLYIGYVGFSVAFSFAIAALIEGRTDAAWARWVRPWTLAAWMFLTMGIAMGSWWAYYELGWGGWWFWDPVENASFMPWLAGTALLHSALVMEKREALKVWTILLAIITFSLSLMGAFLVRSGVLTSVHAFAVDPERGVVILGIMMFFTGGGLALFALRAQELRQGGLFAPISREGSLVFNNVLLTTATATVLIGTLYPLALEGVTGDKISVGAPYFNMTFVPLMLPLLAALPFGPFLAWKRGDLQGAGERLAIAALVGVIAIVVTFAMYTRGPWMAPFAMALGAFVIVGAISELLFRAKFGTADRSEVLRRLWNLPRSVYGTCLAHTGVGIMVLGITATSAYRVEQIQVMRPGDTATVAGYELTFKGVGPRRGPNFREQVGVIAVSKVGDDTPFTTLNPAKRIYDAPPQPTSEAGIHASWAGDLYTVLGDPQSDGKGYAIRVYFNPLVRFIWLGAVIMFLGGMISLTDRRLRVGAPRKTRRSETDTVPGGPIVPAE